MTNSVRVVVHLGPMKTGTSAFAAHLSRAAVAGTLPENLIYPTGDLWFPARGAIVKHHDLVELAPALGKQGKQQRRVTTVTPKEMETRFEAMVREARKRKTDVAVIMVCEIADQRATPALAKALGKFFDRVDFVIVARDQTSALRSLVGQQIRMWNRTDVVSLDPTEFLGKHIQQGSYDYEKLWKKWVTADKSYRAHFVPYRDSRSGIDELSQEIFGRLGLGVFPEDKTGDGSRIHPTFSGKGMKRLATIKRLTARFASIPGVRGLGKFCFDTTLRRLHREAGPGRAATFKPWTFSASQRLTVENAYRDSNECFKKLLGSEAKKPEWQAWFKKALGEQA